MNERLGLFRMAACSYAVPLGRLLRVIDNGRVEPLPLTPDRMSGMLIVDNRVVPLLDSAGLPGVEAGKELGAGFQVLLATEYGTIALPADTTVGIVAETRGKWIAGDQDVTGFLPEYFYYRKNRFLVLNVDDFIMDLVRS